MSKLNIIIFILLIIIFINNQKKKEIEKKINYLENFNDLSFKINYGSIKFKKTPKTCSNLNILNNKFSNIILIGSEVKELNLKRNFSFPLIIYEKNQNYKHKWINNTNINITLHRMD